MRRGSTRTTRTFERRSLPFRGKFPRVLARLGCAALLLTAALPAHGAAGLFDATKHEMAGNADWVVDADLHDLSMPAYPCTGSTNESRPARFPTTPASGI